MNYRVDVDALLEDARKVGVGLIIAGIIGTVVQHETAVLGFAAIVIGVGFVLIGATRRRT